MLEQLKKIILRNLVYTHPANSKYTLPFPANNSRNSEQCVIPDDVISRYTGLPIAERIPETPFAKSLASKREIA